jgi:hypothetical protein
MKKKAKAKMKKQIESKAIGLTLSAAQTAAPGATTPKPAYKHTPPVKLPVPAGFPHDKGMLLEVFRIQNPSRNRACNDHAMEVITQLAPPDCTVVRHKGNLLIRKGPAEGPHPYFLAHMDQVHHYEPFMKVRISGTLLHATDGNDDRCGVGGDDKCGIYLALMMLHALPHCTAVFVRDEEVGCLGSGDISLRWFDHAAFVIQADRNNRTMDVIRDTNGMTCASDEFMDAILALPICKAAGHREASGSVTDIGELSERGLDVSMINISSGYHSPHSRNETVLLDELAVALQLAYEAATTMGSMRWNHTPKSQWGSYKAGYTSPYQSPAWSATARDAQWGKERDPWSDDWDKGLQGNVYGNGDLLNAGEAAAMQEELDDAAYKLEMITELTTLYGYDREFDCLDNWDIADLEDVLEDLESKAATKG